MKYINGQYIRIKALEFALTTVHPDATPTVQALIADANKIRKYINSGFFDPDYFEKEDC